MIELAMLRLQLTSLKIQIETALLTLDRIEEAKREPVIPPSAYECQHPREYRTDLTTMGDPVNKFYCGACRATITTTDAVG